MRKSKTSKAGAAADDSGGVNAYMAALDHPLKAEIEALRNTIRGVDKGISEHIKWNAPSFVFNDDFATFKLRPATSVQIIFHTGAKSKGKKVRIDDPDGLLKWAADDRAVATFLDAKQVRARQAALAAIVRQWINQM